jgi:hypothetical protein
LLKYVHDYKTGKFSSTYDFIISNSKEGGVINSISDLSLSDIPSSIIPNPISNLPFHDNSANMGVSAKSGVIIISNSPRVLYLPCNPPIPQLPLVSTFPLFRPTIVLDEIPIPACPLIIQRFLNCSICLHLLRKAGDKIIGFVKDNTSVTLPEYFHYSLF